MRLALARRRLALQVFQRVDQGAGRGLPAGTPQADDLRVGRVLVPARLLEGCPGRTLAVGSLEDGVFALLAEWMHLT